MINEGSIEINIKNKIAEIEFFHPKSNSLPGKLLRELADKINELDKNDNVLVLVLKSKGDKAFCAGASFDDLISISEYENGKKFFMGFALVINAIRKSSKFVIARVQGKTVGGGVGLASAADYTLATNSASIKLSELALGIGPFVVGPAVERKIGTAAFSAMSIDYDWHSAEWAREKGLYSETYNSIEELDKAIEEISNRLANGSPEAMKELKRVLWEGTEHWDKLLEERAELSGKLVLSDFTKKYISTFKGK